MSKKSDKSELLNIVTKPQKRYERIWLSCATLIFSVLGLFVAWWFWHTIIQGTERPQFDVIGYLATIGLAIAGLVGIISSLLISMRQPAAVTTFRTAVITGLVSFIGVVINSIVTFIRHDDIDWLQSLGQAFRDFSVIEIGSLNVSIPMVLTIAVIISIILTDILKGKK